MKKTKILKGFFPLITIAFLVGCNNLDEQILDGKDEGEAINGSSVLIETYKDLRSFQAQGQMFALDEMSTDALVGPTRGGDWDDNGAWRKIHLHQWDPEHIEVKNAYNALLSGVNDCNIVIANTKNVAEINEARFLKAFFNFKVVDFFGQLAYREIGSPKSADAKVYNRAEATAYIISELEAILPNLPARSANAPEKVNQDAARFLLAKLYLNKGVFTATNPVGPYTFASEDMTKVVKYVDAMTNTLAPDYWDNFAPTNNTSNELVFVAKNEYGAGKSGDVRSRWHMGAHYSQQPSGWNGFCTLGEYYDRYNPMDKRIFNPKPSVIANNGYNLGFQIGQQYGPGGTEPLTDRIDIPGSNPPVKQPLVFTKAITIITGGATLESAGIRGIKYQPDLHGKDGDDNGVDNDYVFMRYSDALLMKAEAIARGGSGTVPNMTAYFARTGQPAVTLDLPGIYAERGRELWWEGWRRNDMIRFGKFLEARQLKTNVSDSKYILYPIPTAALYNPNIKQNPGY
jgi:starch-binding outer membrane protein, SusD/RagB family